MSFALLFLFFGICYSLSLPVPVIHSSQGNFSSSLENLGVALFQQIPATSDHSLGFLALSFMSENDVFTEDSWEYWVHTQLEEGFLSWVHVSAYKVENTFFIDWFRLIAEVEIPPVYDEVRVCKKKHHILHNKKKCHIENVSRGLNHQEIEEIRQVLVDGITSAVSYAERSL